VVTGGRTGDRGRGGGDYDGGGGITMVGRVEIGTIGSGVRVQGRYQGLKLQRRARVRVCCRWCRVDRTTWATGGSPWRGTEEGAERPHRNPGCVAAAEAAPNGEEQDRRGPPGRAGARSLRRKSLLDGTVDQTMLQLTQQTAPLPGLRRTGSDLSHSFRSYAVSNNFQTCRIDRWPLQQLHCD
jgi:hypothetical protein